MSANDAGTPAIQEIVANVQASRRYRNVCASTIRRIAAVEWKKCGALKPAIKGVKSKLHQVYGAYETSIDYDRAFQALRAAYAGESPEDVQTACRHILSRHASTRERLPILDRFYRDVFAHTGLPGSLVDLACGLNPLSMPWMGLGEGTVYHAYDIDRARIAFLDRYFSLAGVRAYAHLGDVICNPPTERADLGLLFKSATCLEQQQRGSTLALLDALDVRYAVVTFPVTSLGHREKGMSQHYANAFRGMLSDRPWPVTRLDFSTELAFIVDKQ